MLDRMTYPGGKNGPGICQRIINHMPPHEAYIEPFLGSGAVMRMKKPARLNHGFDLSQAAIDLFWSKFNSQEARTLAELFGGKYTITQCDALEHLAEYTQDARKTDLIYCDPPYMPETRSAGRIYEHELDAGQHARLVGILGGIRAMIMISGYPHPLYDKAFSTANGWHRITYKAMTRAGRQATECLWMNFAPPAVLHDYRFLGKNFTERQGIKRKIARWTKKLQAMDATERRAILQAVHEAFDDPGIR